MGLMLAGRDHIFYWQNVHRTPFKASGCVAASLQSERRGSSRTACLPTPQDSKPPAPQSPGSPRELPVLAWRCVPGELAWGCAGCSLQWGSCQKCCLLSAVGLPIRQEVRSGAHTTSRRIPLPAVRQRGVFQAAPLSITVVVTWLAVHS